MTVIPDVPSSPDAMSAITPEPEPVFPVWPGPIDADPEPPTIVSADDLDSVMPEIRRALKAQKSVVIPTDTVYGIAADAFSATAVENLLAAKGRERDMPVAVLIAESATVDALARNVPQAARDLAAAHWPGPLTLILPAHSSLRMDLGRTNGTIGVRVPDHDVARRILRATGPLAVSSANRTGKPAGTSAAEAAAQLGRRVEVYVDAGPTPGAIPSTIVDFSNGPVGRILRVGVLTVEQLRRTAWDLQAPDGYEEPASAAEHQDDDEHERYPAQDGQGTDITAGEAGHPDQAGAENPAQ